MPIVTRALNLILAAAVAVALVLPYPIGGADVSPMAGIHQAMAHELAPPGYTGPLKAAVNLCKQHCLVVAAILPSLATVALDLRLSRQAAPDVAVLAAFERPEPQGPPPKSSLS